VRRGVLVVEDEAIVAETIREALGHLGYPVSDVVNSGEAAVQHATEYRPDLVLMDIRLRGALGGIGAARAIRDRVGAPVVFLTASSDIDTLRCATETEPFGFLIKPVRDEDLRSAIEVALAKHRTEMRLRSREQSLMATAMMDELTGLYNRRGFKALAEQALKGADRQRHRTQLLFADIDGLKHVNDTLGHDAGDRTIREAAALLRSAFRTSDIVARLGGDEFVVLCTDGIAQAASASERFETLIRNYNSSAHRPPLELSISWGWAIWDSDRGETIDELLKRADQAMYEHKARRKAATARTERPPDKRRAEPAGS
jgi:diguanylate cyclase (GGDEF)-like protein